MATKMVKSDIHKVERRMYTQNQVRKDQPKLELATKRTDILTELESFLIRFDTLRLTMSR